MDPGIAEGVHLFNHRQFFQAHEALEAVWLKAQGDQKAFLHGLIQIAAAFHHHARHNPTGFRSLLDKGFKKLEAFGAARHDIDLNGLRKQLQAWRDCLKAPQTAPTDAPPLPHIRRIRAH